EMEQLTARLALIEARLTRLEGGQPATADLQAPVQVDMGTASVGQLAPGPATATPSLEPAAAMAMSAHGPAADARDAAIDALPPQITAQPPREPPPPRGPTLMQRLLSGNPM